MTEDKLRETLASIGIEVYMRRGHNLTACCPYHSETRPSWGIRLDEPHVHGCFACGAKGNLYTLLVEIGNVPPDRAKALCEIDKVFDFKPLAGKVREVKTIPEYELYPFALEGEGLRYMTRVRGVRRSVLEKVGVVFDTEGRRVLFPWYIEKHLMVVTGRTTDPNVEDDMKVISYFGTRKGAALFLPQRCITSEPFVLVEGEIDALKVYQAGFHNIGATGQGRLTDSQKNLVLKSPCSTVIIFTDDDKAGDQLAESMYEAFSDHKIVLQVDYSLWRGPVRTKKSDPAGLRPEVVQTLVANARGKVFFNWKLNKR